MTLPISEIKRLMEKATLEYKVVEIAMRGESLLQMGDIYASGRSVQMKSDDAELIVALRNAMPAIIARMEKLEKVAQAARKAIDGIDKWERFESIGSDRLEDWEDVERALAALNKEAENTPRIIPQNDNGQAGQGVGK